MSNDKKMDQPGMDTESENTNTEDTSPKITRRSFIKGYVALLLKELFDNLFPNKICDSVT